MVVVEEKFAQVCGHGQGGSTSIIAIVLTVRTHRLFLALGTSVATSIALVSFRLKPGRLGLMFLFPTNVGIRVVLADHIAGLLTTFDFHWPVNLIN